MSLWMSIVLLLGLIKLPIAALMLWLPFRDDEAMNAPPGGSDEDGGSKALPASPLDPRPRRPSGDPRLPGAPPPARPRPGSAATRPRRDPHGSPAPLAPRRVRTAAPDRPRVLGELRSSSD